MSFRVPKNIFMYFHVVQSLGPCLRGCSGYRCCRKTRVLQIWAWCTSTQKTLPDPLGSECQNAANLTCSHKVRICKRPSVLLKSHLNLFVWCLGLDAAFTAVVGFPCAVEGARTRNLGRRGLPGSPLTSGIARVRKLQAHRDSGEQMEHVPIVKEVSLS